MDINNALIALSSLSQETRLQIYRLLIQYGKEGVPAGKIGETLGVAHNTLSFHLSQLSHAGLIASRRESRSIIYSANLRMMNELVEFLVENCCQNDGKASPDCLPSSTKASACRPAVKIPGKKRKGRPPANRF